MDTEDDLAAGVAEAFADGEIDARSINSGNREGATKVTPEMCAEWNESDATPSELARQIDVSENTVRYHLDDHPRTCHHSQP